MMELGSPGADPSIWAVDAGENPLGVSSVT